MKIEKGKTYSLSNMFKKTFVEISHYNNADGKQFRREIGWRGGSMLVCPVYDSEVEQLQTLVDAGENLDMNEETCLTDFAENEFSDTWDGCWEDYQTHQDWAEALEEMHEAFWDDEELQENHFDFGSYMEEEHGYDMSDTEAYIIGPVEIEEMTEYKIEVDLSEYEE